MATNEVLVSDEELDALMAELEAETADLSPAAPTPKAKEPEPVEVEVVPESVIEPEPVVVEGVPEVEEVPEVVAEVEPPKKKPKLVKVPEPTSPPPVAPTITAPVVSTPAALPEQPMLKHYIDVDRFAKDMRISETTLDSAMMEQASLRAFHGAEAAYAEAQHARLKRRFEVKEAALYKEIREMYAARGEKATEKAIENDVKLDPRWLKMYNTVIEAETIAAVAKSCSLSLNDRRDMLIQLGADRREEGKGAVRIMAAQASHTDARQRAMDAAR